MVKCCHSERLQMAGCWGLYSHVNCTRLEGACPVAWRGVAWRGMARCGVVWCGVVQVLRDDKWYTVQPIPGALTINVGDMAQVR
jgi:hypothetical protein